MVSKFEKSYPINVKVQNYQKNLNISDALSCVTLQSSPNIT